MHLAYSTCALRPKHSGKQGPGKRMELHLLYETPLYSGGLLPSCFIHCMNFIEFHKTSYCGFQLPETGCKYVMLAIVVHHCSERGLSLPFLHSSAVAATTVSCHFKRPTSCPWLHSSLSHHPSRCLLTCCFLSMLQQHLKNHLRIHLLTWQLSLQLLLTLDVPCMPSLACRSAGHTDTERGGVGEKEFRMLMHVTMYSMLP